MPTATKKQLTEPKTPPDVLSDDEWRKPKLYLRVTKAQLEDLEVGDAVSIKVLGKVTGIEIRSSDKKKSNLGSIDVDIESTEVYKSGKDSFADLTKDY